jgi:hypothetical protein
MSRDASKDRALTTPRARRDDRTTDDADADDRGERTHRRKRNR